MPFLQLELQCTASDPLSAPDALEAACFEAGALSVTLTDAADHPILEPALNTTPLWPRSRLTALFDPSSKAAQILARLASILGHEVRDPHFTEIADRAWEREWLSDFKPMRFGKRLWVCPHEQTVHDEGATVVHLDPGLAFGTGTHQTTALCLEWLDGAALEGRTVIDYGCGSGILAIAAIKLGARRAWCVDHDPQALLATRDNAERNHVSDEIVTLEPGAGLAAADVLLANILALPLVELAPVFEPMVRRKGHLVLSGILTGQAPEVAAAYAAWAAMDPAVQRDDWVRLHGVKH